MKIKVSPHHSIEVSPQYEDLIKEPRNEDYLLHVILNKKDAYGETLIQTELTIAGKKTLKQFPATQEYPVHFVKRYSLSSYHNDPEIEYENGLEIQKYIDISTPLGADAKTFRNCFIPGVGLDKKSPFGVEPLYRNIDIAEEAEPKDLRALWKHLESAFQHTTTLHQNNWIHGDLELHNIIVSDKPVNTYLIDLESALPRDKVDHWENACLADLEHIMRDAIYIQCALGKKDTSLGKTSRQSLEQLFKDPEEFADLLV